MQILIDLPWENTDDWLAEFRRQATHHELHRWPDVDDPDCIDAAVVWTPTADLFSKLSRLKAIIVPGAGVDQLWRHIKQLPDVPIVRLADPVMATRMAEYVLAMVLNHHRGFERYRRQQIERVWTRHQHADPGDIQVGIMGLGELGAAAARHVAAIGYDVKGWSRRPKEIEGVRTFSGDAGFRDFLPQTDILVCLLPLTAATRELLNARTFSSLSKGGLVINAARGEHLVVPDLHSALDSGQLAGAVLDVFENEPLSADSPLWAHPKITITPHIASLSNVKTGVRQIVRALDAIEAGDRPDHIVDPVAGY
ncbi:MAG: 2-hydroxyacid dehydrogenase [Geminicoccaceae bacterium]